MLVEISVGMSSACLAWKAKQLYTHYSAIGISRWYKHLHAISSALLFMVFLYLCLRHRFLGDLDIPMWKTFLVGLIIQSFNVSMLWSCTGECLFQQSWIKADHELAMMVVKDSLNRK